MAEPKHVDLLVVNGDFVIDLAGFAEPVSDRQSIGQDIKHRIIESGLLPLLIAQRSEQERNAITNKILIEVDKDKRLKAGTAKLVNLVLEPGTYYLTAQTLEYGDFKVYLNN